MRNYAIKKIAVIGAGTMGSSISVTAALSGLEVLLLDIPQKEGDRNDIAKRGVVKAFHNEIKDQDISVLNEKIRYGNIEDDMSLLKDYDLVLEAVVENLEIKRNVAKSVFENTGPDTIVATNTSNIPINKIVEGLDEKLQARFTGMHFFNPVSIMKLVEIIPSSHLTETNLERVNALAENVLKKKPIICKDVLGFVANRVGSYACMSVLHRAKQFGLDIYTADQLAGKIVFRPKTAVFKLEDIMGIDVEYESINYFLDQDLPEWEIGLRQMPEILEQVYLEGNYGYKTGQGFYRKNMEKREYWDYQAKRYKTLDMKPIPLLEKVDHIEDRMKRLKEVLEDGSHESAYVKMILVDSLWFSAMCIGMICEDPEAIDKAMRYGWNWEMGPFEMIDALGKKYVIAMIDELGLTMPEYFTESRR